MNTSTEYMIRVMRSEADRRQSEVYSTGAVRVTDLLRDAAYRLEELEKENQRLKNKQPE